MKIYVNRKPVSGPWGGGNKTLSSLVAALSLDNDVTFSLDDDVDIIYCQDPKPGADGLWYQDFLNHKLKYGSKIVQRVGDIGTHRGPQITKLVQETTQYSDIVIFPSDWARQAIRFDKSNYFVIHNAPDDGFYQYRDVSNKLKTPDKVNIVTHHWSTNDMKGFEIYEALGRHVKDRDDITFSYIGRYSDNFSSEGIDIQDPKDVTDLASTLPLYDIYLTASKLEAGANHVLEGLACGLPILYRSEGGSIGEYSCRYGLQYENFSQLLNAIESLKCMYPLHKSNVLKYDNKISDVIRTYVEVIGSL